MKQSFGGQILSEGVAYVVAVLAATVITLLVFGVHTGDAAVFSLFPLVAIVTLLFALPGTLIARLILFWRTWDGFAAHAVAGAMVGVVTGVLPEVIGGHWVWRDHGPLGVAMLLAGLAGGLVFHAVQRLQRPVRVADDDLTKQDGGMA
ncbi:MAG: hypothetical protein MUF73_07070 [Rhodobacteraceae bacterium]|nr:hypothetical protein [Paracoccaceae bacterium]